MKNTFHGWLFNRMEKFGEQTYNHVGCEGDHAQFIDFLTQFVPEVGMRRRVTFTVESQTDAETIDAYTIAKDYQEDPDE